MIKLHEFKCKKKGFNLCMILTIIMTTTKKRNNKGNNRSRKIVEQCEVSLEIVIKLGIENNKV